MQFAKKFLPVLSWFPHYKRSDLKGDISAGLTVGVMLIPQGMAYAMIAGLPPIYGLYASTVPLIIYALLGTSRQLAVGPVAMVSLLTATGVAMLASGNTALYISLAIMLAFLVGIIQFLLGVFKLGFLVNFLSHPVISGFTSAAALIIGLNQLKHLMGVNLPKGKVHEIILAAIQNIPAANLYAVGIGVAGILVIKLVPKVNKNIPGSLASVIFGIIAVWGLGLTDRGVKIVGEVPGGLPAFILPEFSTDTLLSLIPIALTISLVSFMESIAVAKAIQSKHRNYKVDANQELVALGIANIAGSFFQSYPVTGGFSRTAVNDQAGARTGLASIFSALLIILTLLFLTPLFYYLPNAILASVIMVAVFGLIDVKEAVHLWHSDRQDFFMLLVTFLATLAFGIEEGIGAGVILSLAMVIFRTTRPHVAVLGKVPNTSFYRNVDRFEGLEQREDLLVLRFDAQLYFANVNHFKDTLETLIAQKGKNLKAVIINGESMNQLDSSGVHALEEILEHFRDQGIDLFFASIKGPVRDAMNRSHLIEKIGENHFFMSIQEAVNFVDTEKRPTTNQYVLQVNK